MLILSEKREDVSTLMKMGFSISFAIVPMQIKEFFIILLCAPIVTFLGCSTIQCGTTKDHFINQYDRFIDEVKELQLSATDSRWKIYDDSFEAYILECFDRFEEEMSFAEKQDLLYRAVEYYFHRYKTDMFRELDNPENEVSVFLKSRLYKIWEEPEKLFREITGEDWDMLLEDFKEDVSKWKERFEEMMSTDDQKKN